MDSIGRLERSIFYILSFLINDFFDCRWDWLSLNWRQIRIGFGHCLSSLQFSWWCNHFIFCEGVRLAYSFSDAIAVRRMQKRLVKTWTNSSSVVIMDRRHPHTSLRSNHIYIILLRRISICSSTGSLRASSPKQIKPISVVILFCVRGVSCRTFTLLFGARGIIDWITCVVAEIVLLSIPRYASPDSSGCRWLIPLLLLDKHWHVSCRRGRWLSCWHGSVWLLLLLLKTFIYSLDLSDLLLCRPLSMHLYAFHRCLLPRCLLWANLLRSIGAARVIIELRRYRCWCIYRIVLGTSIFVSSSTSNSMESCSSSCCGLLWVVFVFIGLLWKITTRATGCHHEIAILLKLETRVRSHSLLTSLRLQLLAIVDLEHP